jgi:hypothetical protein
MRPSTFRSLVSSPSRLAVILIAFIFAISYGEVDAARKWTGKTTSTIARGHRPTCTTLVKENTDTSQGYHFHSQIKPKGKIADVRRWCLIQVYLEGTRERGEVKAKSDVIFRSSKFSNFHLRGLNQLGVCAGISKQAPLAPPRQKAGLRAGTSVAPTPVDILYIEKIQFTYLTIQIDYIEMWRREETKVAIPDLNLHARAAYARQLWLYNNIGKCRCDLNFWSIKLSTFGNWWGQPEVMIK